MIIREFELFTDTHLPEDAIRFIPHSKSDNSNKPLRQTSEPKIVNKFNLTTEDQICVLKFIFIYYIWLILPIPKIPTLHQIALLIIILQSVFDSFDPERFELVFWSTCSDQTKRSYFSLLKMREGPHKGMFVNCVYCEPCQMLVLRQQSW